MSTNRISVTVPGDVISEATAALKRVKALLDPYVQSLTVEERRELAKMSDKSFSFVSKVNDYCVSNPEFCPSYLNAEELDKDFNVVSALNPIYDLCEQVCMNIDDTIMLVGSEAYTASLTYYGSVQMAAKTGQVNAKSVYEDLHQRFAGMGKRPKPAPVV
jgi:hypothetical protein